MLSEQAITENLRDAGCNAKETQAILTSLRQGDRYQADKLIAACRKKQLDKLHESQICIDRLDYLSLSDEQTMTDDKRT